MRIRPPRWLRLAVVGCLTIGAVPGSAHAQATKVNKNPVEAPEVRKLRLNGVHSVDAVDLEKSISTTATHCRNALVTPFCLIFSNSASFNEKEYLDRGELARDIIRIRVYYWRRGYRSADVDTVVKKVADKRVEVDFNITEGDPTLVRRIRIDYDSVLLRPKRVSKLTLLKAGQPLDLVRLDSMRVGFANEMWGEGHSDAQVDTSIVVDATRRFADVRLTLIPNHATYVGDVIVTGLDKVSRQTVLNSITLQPGDLYRQQDVLESQRNLFESNLFRLATVEVPPTFDSVKQVQVTLSESPLHDAHVGVGMTNIDYIQTDAQYTAYNLLGGARRLDLNTTVGNIGGQQLAGKGFFYNPADVVTGADAGKYLQPTWAASVDFLQPAFLHRPKNQASFSAFAHRRSTPGIFIDRGYGGSVTLTDQVLQRAPLSLTYRYEINRVDAGDVYFCINYGVCDPENISSLRAHQSLSPLLLTGFIDRSDDPLDPTKGYQARTEFEYASSLTLSDYKYSRGFFDVAAYNHHGYANTYGAHLRLGFVRAGAGETSLHPRKLFYAGGATSVRGFSTNQLGPRVLTIAPEKLVAAGCDSADIQACDPDALPLSNSDFKPQPLGGTSLLEWSVEYRIPIAFQRKLTLAGFIDGGVVGSGNFVSLTDLSNLRNLVSGSSAVTPGIGIRYKSAVGPIRVDLGFNPSRTEDLQVVTETIQNGERHIVPLSANGIPLTRSYNSGTRLLDRLTLHLSIGQPY
jgi:outer membrane protein assembly factor BamA